MGYLVKKHNSHVDTIDHHRVLFPVGQGGFAFETIEGFSVVYDCGSVTSPTRVSRYIDALAANGIHGIDFVVLSHYDVDHVNGLQYLLSKIRVKRVLSPAIPADLHIVYDIATRGAYSLLHNLAVNKEFEIIHIESEERRTYDKEGQPIWEWITKSMLTQEDFQRLRDKLLQQGVDVNSLDTLMHGSSDIKKRINNAFKNAFGYTGPNAKGLIMLSQKTEEVQLDISLVTNGYRYGFCHVSSEEICEKASKTGCLYTGDAVLKKSSLSLVLNFWISRSPEKQLALMQIPHHGSRYNYEDTIDSDFLAEWCFVCDKDEQRIRKMGELYNRLTSTSAGGHKKLWMVQDVCKDLLLQESNVYPQGRKMRP